MARDYARIMTAIWRNVEFRGLTEQQQRAYLFLVTQPDISAAGVLPLRVRRWADAASSSTPDGLAQLFKELESGRFIVVDWDAEELLIRSFIRWDGGFNNPKRRPVIIRAAEDVESSVIAQHIAMEFKRCGIVPPPDGPSGGAEPPIDPPVDTASGRAPDSLSKIDRVELDDEPFPQVNSLSDTAPTNHGRVPQPSTLNPQPIPTPTASAAEAAPGAQLAVIHGGAADPPTDTTARTLVAEWIDVCRKRPPRAVIGQTSKAIKTMLDEGVDPDDIRAGITAWSAKGLHPSALPSVVNQAMNATAGPTSWARSGASPTADDKILGWQSLKTGTDNQPAMYALPGGDST